MVIYHRCESTGTDQNHTVWVLHFIKSKIIVGGKNNAVPGTCFEDTWGQSRSYSSYLFLTSVADRVSGQNHAVAAFYSWGNEWHLVCIGTRAGLDAEAGKKSFATAGIKL
jgi:hypothetical protein